LCNSSKVIKEMQEEIGRAVMSVGGRETVHSFLVLQPLHRPLYAKPTEACNVTAILLKVKRKKLQTAITERAKGNARIYFLQAVT
jgi:hypothetical protein